VSERPYKKAFSHEEAVQIIRDGSGTQFEPALVDLFLHTQDRFKETAERITPLRSFISGLGEGEKAK
jgi:putative two-component system response regulator